MPNVGSRLGRYDLIEVIGRGGMGVVFRARDPALNRELAIKVLNAERAGAREQVRFLEEARAMAKLRHPSVLPVFDVGRIGAHLHIVMPLVSGGTLHEWLAASRRPWREVIARFVTAGRGLAAAHAVGLVHRDFKPSNVLVEVDGSVMVADFGIAARVDGMNEHALASTKVSSVAGTPAYMAPEQACGGEIDARADQYSYCVSLWEGLFGERPHQAPTQTAVGRITRSIFVPKAHREIPEWVSDALLRGLSQHPAQRWPSMTALLDHLERRLTDSVIVDTSVAARPRRAWISALIVLTAIVIGVGLAIRRQDDVDPEAAPPVVHGAGQPRETPPANTVVVDEKAVSAESPPPRPVEAKPRRARGPNAEPGDAAPPIDQDLSRSRF